MNEIHMNFHRLTKQQLFELVLAHRDAGTITGKFLKKVRARALTLMHDTSRGGFVDVDLIWIGAGCPKGKEPHTYLNTVGRMHIEKLAGELGCKPSDLVITDTRSVN